MSYKYDPPTTESPQTQRLRAAGLPDDTPFPGGITYFDGMTGYEYQALFDKGLADPEACQNNSPPEQEMVDFCKKFPHFRVSGYIVCDSRSDSRISITTIISGENRPLRREELIAFSEEFHGADEFTLEDDFARAWYD